MQQHVFTLIPKDTPLKQLDGSVTKFKKQLVRFGDWIDPIWPEEIMTFDKVKFETFIRNFKNQVPGRIPVPLTHTDNPEWNAGELVDMMVEGDGSNETDGLYGILEIRREEVAQDIVNNLIWDVSISFTDNYQDNETGALYGFTIIHVALVNNPYIKKMNPFVALADMFKKQFSGASVRMLSENANKETAMSKVKNDREFPVDVVYEKDGKEVKVTMAAGDELELDEAQVEAVQTAIADATAPEVKETDEEKSAREAKEAEEAEAARKAKEEADANLSEHEKTKRELAETKAKLLDKNIDESYQKSLKDGKIVPAQEAAFKALSLAVHGQVRTLSDGKTQNLSELLAEFVAKAPKVVSLDEENGKITNDSDKGPLAKLSTESKQGLAKARVSEQDYATFGSRETISINELPALSGSGKKESK